MTARYVLLGLAGPRVPWFLEVGRWATGAMLPAEFVRCVSVDELRARLCSGQAFAAAIVDGGVIGLDADVIADAEAVGSRVLVVDDTGRDWTGLGATAVLPGAFSREQLLAVLDVAVPEPRAAHLDEPAGGAAEGARLVAVTGPGGTGASTGAIAVAQGCATADPSRSVLLADLCRVADQALLHDAGQLVPGIQELVEAHRTGSPTREAVLEQTFTVETRGYRLLLGLRRPHQWTLLAPQAVERTLAALLGATDVLVADVEADVEGERRTGSADLEDRHRLARLAFTGADAVVVVAEPSFKGLHAAVRVLSDLVEAGVAPAVLLVAFNRAPRSVRLRAELTTALANLAAGVVGPAAARMPGPVFLPRVGIERALRDGARLPAAFVRPLAGGVAAVLRAAGSA